MRRTERNLVRVCSSLSENGAIAPLGAGARGRSRRRRSAGCLASWPSARTGSRPGAYTVRTCALPTAPRAATVPELHRPARWSAGTRPTASPTLRS
jgi:hypothetical protein